MCWAWFEAACENTLTTAVARQAKSATVEAVEGGRKVQGDDKRGAWSEALRVAVREFRDRQMDDVAWRCGHGELVQRWRAAARPAGGGERGGEQKDLCAWVVRAGGQVVGAGASA